MSAIPVPRPPETFSKNQAVEAVTQAIREVKAGKILRGDLDEIAAANSMIHTASV